MLEIAAVESRMDIVKHLLEISQMVVQGICEETNPLCQLPGVFSERGNASELSKRIKSYNLRNGKADESGSNLPGLLQIPNGILASWTKDLIDNEYCDNFLQVVKRLPVISLDFHAKHMQSISANGEIDLRVFLKCDRGDPSCRIYAPRFNKPKRMSWYLLLSSSSKSSYQSPVLLGIKRVDLKGSVTSTSFIFQKPDNANEVEFKIEVISDSMAGISTASRIVTLP